MHSAKHTTQFTQLYIQTILHWKKTNNIYLTTRKSGITLLNKKGICCIFRDKLDGENGLLVE